MIHRNQTNLSRTQAVRRVSALALLACASSFTLQAQRVVLSDSADKPVAQIVADGSTHPLNLATAAGVDYGSSSSSTTGDGGAAGTMSFAGLDATQPPPRRRYGRPRYNDSSHNPDGSNKYTAVVGIGMTAPIGNTYHYLNTGYAFQVGVGRNFNKNLGLLAQFDYDRFGFNGSTLYDQRSLYNYYCTVPLQRQGACTPLPSLDGNTHVWSFTLNPIYNIFSSGPVGAYLVAGAGFYHKVANFTTPVNAIAYDPYYGNYSYTANQVIDHYTSNAPGFSGGLGLTYKLSQFANERLFVEGRYVFVDNQQRYGVTAHSSQATLNTYLGSNQYPANSNRTSYLAFKAGVRF